MSNATLQKVVTAQYLDAQAVGGDNNRGTPILTPDQSDAFLNYIWDSTALGQDVRRVRMRADTMDLDRIAVGERLLRVATEAVDDHVNARAKFARISLKTTKLRFDWELSTEAIEDNVQGASLEDTIANLFATQMGNDMEDLAINGDASVADTLMSAFDGYRKIVTDHGNVKVSTDAQANGVSRKTFGEAVKMLDRKYMQNRNGLKFYVGSNILQDYTETLIAYEPFQRSLIEGDQYSSRPSGPATNATQYVVSGIPVAEIPMLPENLSADGTAIVDSGTQYGTIELTFPNNRIWGIKREVTVYEEFVPKKDTTEWTLFTRVGAQVENPDAYVIINGVKIAE
jgi:hypothetical protein